MPYPVLRLGGLFNPMAHAARETQYQFRKPFVLDSTAAAAAFGISPTPLDDALHETIADLRSRPRRLLQRSGIGRHHNSRVSPTTPPAEVVSLADRHSKSARPHITAGTQPNDVDRPRPRFGGTGHRIRSAVMVLRRG
jgi:hypothetical protein